MNTRQVPGDNGSRPGVGVEGALRNELLSEIPPNEADLIFPELEFVRLMVHQILHETGDKIKSVYFVATGLVSVVNLTSDGKTVEVGLIGKSGFAGLPIVDGFYTSPNREVTQAPGTAYRMESDTLTRLLPQCPILAHNLHRFSQRLTMQAMQIAACNRLHEVDERLARWLLMSRDLLDSNELPLTQELLGQMLGTRRSSVSLAASMLQKAGVITYTRGNVTILDGAKLLSVACECYCSIQKHLKDWELETQNP